MSRVVGEESVLLDLESGMYFGLDGVGQRVWELIGEDLALREIVAVIVSEYEIEHSEAQADVIAFVHDLVERGLLAE